MNLLFLFLDGVGLGPDNPEANPFASADMPNLQHLLGGNKLLASNAPLESARATLLSLDANLGVPGLPQSASGQGVLLTGKNIPAMIGEHYGPKPNPPVAEIIKQGTVFSQLSEAGYQSMLINAYPQGYFDGINSGKRLYSAIPLAVTQAGLPLKTADDLHNGEALSADFTAKGWNHYFKDHPAPQFSSEEAGKELARLATEVDFSFFEFWPSDYAGHRQDKTKALELLEDFDQVLGGLLAAWNDDQGLILITSDHGNLEDLSTRRHTHNPVPGLVIGNQELRNSFCEGITSLVDVAPAIRTFFNL